jgi:hypothetical protein
MKIISVCIVLLSRLRISSASMSLGIPMALESSFRGLRRVEAAMRHLAAARAASHGVPPRFEDTSHST